jgi:hypothetical protein
MTSSARAGACSSRSGSRRAVRSPFPEVRRRRWRSTLQTPERRPQATAWVKHASLRDRKSTRADRDTRGPARPVSSKPTSSARAWQGGQFPQLRPKRSRQAAIARPPAAKWPGLRIRASSRGSRPSSPGCARSSRRPLRAP